MPRSRGEPQDIALGPREAESTVDLCWGQVCGETRVSIHSTDAKGPPKQRRLPPLSKGNSPVNCVQLKILARVTEYVCSHSPGSPPLTEEKNQWALKTGVKLRCSYAHCQAFAKACQKGSGLLDMVRSIQDAHHSKYRQDGKTK